VKDNTLCCTLFEGGCGPVVRRPCEDDNDDDDDDDSVDNDSESQSM
jgi:hypothetical protein